MTDSARLMGVVNVTPDSFSDGGLFLDAEAAIAHGRELAAEGAQPLTVSVPAGETVYLGTGTDGGEGLDATLDAVAAMPGEDLETTLSGAGAQEEFFLPVFDGTLPEYADFVPEAVVGS